ncbi:MAG: hypothetical protein ABUK01_15290 [Leptospirales bacterium]
MINKIFQNFFRILAIAAFATVGMLNIIVAPAGSVILLVDKTSGLQKPYLKPGYHWNWTGFVPKKWKLYTLDMAPPPVTVSYVYYLPYSEYLTEPEKYAYHISIKVQFELTDSSIDFFWRLFDEDINRYTKHIEEILKLHLQTVMLDGLNSGNSIDETDAYLRTYFIQNRGVETSWNDIFPGLNLKFVRYEVIQLESPDKERYANQVKDINLIIQAEKDSVIQNIVTQSRLFETNLLNQADIDKAEKFSQLIKDNPAILEYYKIEKINPQATIYITPQDLYGNFRNLPTKKLTTPNGNTAPSTTNANGDHGVLPSFESGQQ